MGFQFVHIEGYARKPDSHGRSVAFILDEAERKPDACTHVTNPLAPELVFGVPLHELRVTHDTKAADARANLASGKSRKARQDQLTLLSVVASHPAEMSEVRSDPAVANAVADWEARVIKWLQATWGEDVVSVVRHLDESHAHLHAYILPTDPEMQARRLHPGVTAKEAVKATCLAGGADAKAANTAGDKAYLAAMRGLQDGFWQTVGLPSGQARIGPGRRRLSRAAWHAEKLAVVSTATALQAADDAERKAADSRDESARILLNTTADAKAAEVLEARAREAAAHARTVVAEARKITAAALVQQAAAKRQERQAAAQARRLVDGARMQARRLLGSARAEAAQIQRRARGLGAWFGGLLHGLRGAHPSRVALEAATAARADAQRAAQSLLDAARDDAKHAHSMLRGTETRLASVAHAAVSIGKQRDSLAAEVEALRANLAAASPAPAPAPAYTPN